MCHNFKCACEGATRLLFLACRVNTHFLDFLQVLFIEFKTVFWVKRRQT